MRSVLHALVIITLTIKEFAERLKIRVFSGKLMEYVLIAHTDGELTQEENVWQRLPSFCCEFH
jgi:hypothetical protein